MTSLKRAAITSVGHYVPPDVYDNHYFESFLETNDQWIRERTGIVERRFLKEGGASDLALPAAQLCLERRGITAADVECIVVATVTPDMIFPPTASILQGKLGAVNAWCFDLEAACSSFLYALNVGARMIESGAHRNVLVVGADKMSAIMNFEDRNTAVLFGDGAGAVLLEPSEDESLGLMDFYLKVDPSGGKNLYQPAGGSLLPPTAETVANKMHYIVQDGKTVFKAAVPGMQEAAEMIMERNHLTADNIRWLVPHQANLRIISATADRMGLPMEKVMVNIDKYGNTTSGTLPICLSEWWERGDLAKGDSLVLVTFGAGYTYGGAYVRWAY
ncbi:MAG: ketoacyl-ACP synthase III [Bacteroidetes bacterium]|nr:ketoacyl-ACP synthase III [Bacteroidota bacterium]